MFTPHPTQSIVKAFEIYQKVDPAIVTDMLTWLRTEERQLYKQSIATLAADRKLRPVFVEKKSVPNQIAFIHKTLKLRTSETIGEHLLQVWFMNGQKDILKDFCDGMEIPHDGQGQVEGSLPETLEEEKLQKTITDLLAKHDPQVVTLYLHVFNLQTVSGWDNLAKALETDDRLAIA